MIMTFTICGPQGYGSINQTLNLLEDIAAHEPADFRGTPPRDVAEWQRAVMNNNKRTNAWRLSICLAAPRWLGLGQPWLCTRLGWPFAAPPDLPPKRLDLLRSAFAQAATDPELIADAQQKGFDLKYVPAAVLTSLIGNAYAANDTLIKKVRNAYSGSP